nr:hypothetical protein [Phaeacidiphilus oryzae]
MSLTGRWLRIEYPWPAATSARTVSKVVLRYAGRMARPAAANSSVKYSRLCGRS